MEEVLRGRAQSDPTSQRSLTVDKGRFYLWPTRAKYEEVEVSGKVENLAVDAQERTVTLHHD